MILGSYGEAIKNDNAELIKSHSEIPSFESHEILSGIIVLFFIIHVVGVIKHYVVTKENTLKRII